MPLFVIFFFIMLSVPLILEGMFEISFRGDVLMMVVAGSLLIVGYLAFEALTPGRRRAYLLYFSAAKQSKTRTSRIEKWIQNILNGKGMDD